MKSKFALVLIPLLFAFYLFATPCILPSTLGEESPADEKSDENSEKPSDKKKEDYDWKIGKDLDGETITKVITDLAEAAQQKGSFWRNPSLWEAVWLVVLVVLGFLAAKFGWKKKKWGKVIQAVEKAVNTIYIEFVREAKLKNEDGKLSKEEMKKALEDAWNMTKEDLLSQGIDLAKWISKEYFPVVVDKILKTVKK